MGGLWLQVQHLSAAVLFLFIIASSCLFELAQQMAKTGIHSYSAPFS